MHHFGNLHHTCIIVNKVLPNLYADMRQIYFFGMVIYREILRGFSRIRFVIADLVARPSQAFEKYVTHLLVLVPQHTHLPLTRFAVQHWSETVNGDKCRRRTRFAETLYLLIDGAVIGPIQSTCPQILVSPMKVAIARHEYAVAVLEECARVHELSVAVNHQSRVIVHHGRYAEGLGQTLRYRTGTDIDRQVATACKWIKSHITQRFGETVAGVVADQQNRMFSKGLSTLNGPGSSGDNNA